MERVFIHLLSGLHEDTPLIGGGIYAYESGAVSMTGTGETIIRLAVTKEIIDNL
jgi:beta-aspartyl-peptidase (threonine type)